MKKAVKTSRSPKASSSKTSSKSKASSGPNRISVEVDKDSTVSARKIENGFIVSESGYEGTGKNQKYYSKEYFSPENPLKFSGLPSGIKQPKFGKR